MGSITIHSIDTELDVRLSDEAKKRKTSKNQLIKNVLARSMGLANAGEYADDYREFCHVWSQVEREVFDALQSDNARIDEGDWRQ